MTQPTKHQWSTKRYRSLRPAFALAAAFATVATLGLAVVTPASLAPHVGEAYAAVPSAVQPPVEVAILPASIEVVATRTKAARTKSPYVPATYRP
ncbi:MAG: hypothetical protein U1F15_12620 [Burkholderiales bacterium]